VLVPPATVPPLSGLHPTARSQEATAESATQGTEIQLFEVPMKTALVIETCSACPGTVGVLARFGEANLRRDELRESETFAFWISDSRSSSLQEHGAPD